MKPVNIAIGWINVAREKIGIADEKAEKLAKVRGEICLACPRINKEKYSCSICGCFIAAKIRVPNEKCPEGKW